MRFDYYNPVRIFTGERCVLKNAGELQKLGRSCLIITSGSAAVKSGALGDVAEALSDLNISYDIFDKVEQNPSLATCRKAGALARETGAEFMVGIGGGSPLDATKAAAVYAANDIDEMDIYNLDWKNPALPFVLIGTTAGTGSEVTPFSILTMPNGRKKSVAHDQLYPRLMFGDARYTATLPLRFTVSTALDSLAHALEGYFSTAANDMTDIYAREAVMILYPQLKLLQKADSAGEITIRQREELYKASVIAGLTLSQCGTLYCHTLGYYLTEEYDVPHGFACAATLDDLLKRGVGLLPEKAARLFDQANTSEHELCGLIETLRELPRVKIPPEEIERLANDGAKTKNFLKTPPNGFSAGEASALLTGLFG